MARYGVGDVFVRKGLVFYLFEHDDLLELFDQPEILRPWNFDEFGRPAKGFCLEGDLPYLEARLKVTREIIAEGKIKVGTLWVEWEKFDPNQLHYEVILFVRKEIEKRMKKEGW